MATKASYVYLGKKCPKCGALGLEATIDADAGVVLLECRTCFARESQPVTRDDAQRAISEREKKNKE